MSQTYYVDARAGSDENAGTSPAAAWASLDKVNSLDLQPGDTVLFARGSEWNGGIDIKASGSADAPITFGAYGEGELPILRGAENGVAGNENDHIVLRNLAIKDTTDGGIETWRSADWVIDGLTIDGAGREYAGDATTGGGIQYWHGEDLTVSNTTVTNAQGDGIWVWEIDGLKLLNNHVDVVQGGSADNIHVTRANNFEIRGNYATMDGPTNSGKGNLVVEDSKDGVIAENTLVEGHFGASVTATDSAITGNKFVGHDSEDWSAGLVIGEVYNVANNTIEGNTFDGDKSGIYVFRKGYERENIQISDNIFDVQDSALRLDGAAMSGSFANNTVVGSADDAVKFNGKVIGGQNWDVSGTIAVDTAPVSSSPAQSGATTSTTEPAAAVPDAAAAQVAWAPTPDMYSMLGLSQTNGSDQ